MKYQINLNGSYINSFKTYSEALEVKENLLRRFPKVRVEIISIA